MKAFWKSYILDFKFPAGTSRGVLLHKPSAFLILDHEGVWGIGECSTIPGLSVDDEENYDSILDQLCASFTQVQLPISELNIAYFLKLLPNLSEFPSIVFGVETALLDLKNGGRRILFPNDFSEGLRSIPINGLVWMGDVSFMNKQIQEKISQGYRCIKLKVGALDFQSELEILENIRSSYDAYELEIRLDANGAFAVDEAYGKLVQLSKYKIHSIEQPIKAGNWKAMADLCKVTPIPVVLDEELIGLDISKAKKMLLLIQPDFIILKPSLIGGIKMSEQWIEIAEELNIKWWITSALESNIGLNSIAQWTSTLNNPMPQGLGTGQLYHNNIPSPLVIENASLSYKPNKEDWDLNLLIDS